MLESYVITCCEFAHMREFTTTCQLIILTKIVSRFLVRLFQIHQSHLLVFGLKEGDLEIVVFSKF